MRPAVGALTHAQRMAFKMARDAATEDYDRVMIDLAEAQSEIDRHHRDFARISGILDDVADGMAADQGLREIRNIVG